MDLDSKCIVDLLFLGDPVTHIYDLKNKGPSTIQEAEVYILWPSFTGYEYDGNQEDLLYLLGVEVDESKVTCQTIKNINPRYVKVNQDINKNTVIKDFGSAKIQ